jgi:Zn ribbon nucleic-acid-binding protein
MQNKRFIAGALCPACKQLDKIFTYSSSMKNGVLALTVILTSCLKKKYGAQQMSCLHESISIVLVSRRYSMKHRQSQLSWLI